MLDRFIHDIVLSFLVGCIACLSMASVNYADGRVFTMDLRGSSSLRGLRGAERACSLQHARLASGAELLRAVQECSFSACTRGWLYDGSVGTTECRNVGSALTAIEVKTENATDPTAHLDAFCIKDTGVPCGDPPSFPNAHLQGAAGLDLGDELLYVCAPGHRMPGGNTAFSLLCDSCGEWYGLVQMCLKDESELHVDYEDKFPDGYASPDAPHSDPPGEGPEAEADHHHDHHGPAHPAAHNTQRQQDQGVFYTVGGRGGPQRHDQQGEEARGAEEEQDPGERGQRGGDVPLLEQQPDYRVTLVRPEAATTAPVSQLSQKHMFWFPSEAFHEEEGYYPAPSDHPPTAQVDQSVESEESRPDDHHRDEEEEEEGGREEGYYDHDHQDDHEEQEDHDDSRHSDHDDRDDHDDHDDHDDRGVHDNSRQEEQEEDDLLGQQSVKPYNPGQRDNTDRYGRYGDDVDPRDHYDMGEHEDDHALYGRVRDSVEREHDVDDEEEESDGGDEDRERDDDEEEESEGDEEHPEQSEEDLDGETAEHDDDHDDHDDHIDSDTDHDHPDDEDAETDDHDERDDHDSHEDEDDADHDEDHDDEDHDEDHDDDHDEDHDDDDVDRHPHDPGSEEEAGRRPASATDRSWLDGYPVGPEEAEKGGSTEEAEPSREQEEVPVVVAVGDVTDKSSEADALLEPPSRGPDSEEQDRVGDAWPGRPRPHQPTPAPGGSHDPSQDSVSSYPDYEHHTEDPALVWDPEDPSSRQPLFPDPDPGATRAPLSGEAGERVPVEGEMGEAVCIGADCPPPPPPPPTSSSRGPIVAAVVVAICAVATVAAVGAWLYRRRQQKNSMYQLNGKDLSQRTPDHQQQQIEMQQKV